MNVFATKSLAANKQPKAIYIKLLPSTAVTKSRLAAMIRIFGDPHEDLDSQQEELNLRPEVDAQSDFTWSTDKSGDWRDQLRDDLYKNRDILAYPFELVTTGERCKLVRRGDPACRLTNGVLMGRYMPSPDSEFNF